jgi:ADP-heptose:LPS heptosyltransferase
MRDSFLKRIEILLRRFLIFVLGSFVSRRKLPPDTIDFNSSKILFIRQDRIGDVLISTPIFTSIKAHYPSAIVDVLLSENNHFVLMNDPFIRKRWIYRKNIGKVISLITSLRNEKYDFAVDMMDNPSVTSTFLCLFAGARWNVGIAKNNNYVYDIKVPMLSRSETHIVDRISQLLIPFHIDPKAEILSTRYFTSRESDEFAARFLSSNILCQRPLIGINISAGGEVRFWGIEQYRELLSFIADRYPELCPIVLYQPSDKEKARKICDGNKNIVLSPLTNTFDQFAAIIKQLTFLVSPDTSAIHLASAFNIPAVVLYVQSNKALRIWEPYGIEYEVVVTDVDDLSTIPVKDVQTALKKLIDRNRKKTISYNPPGITTAE